MIKSIIILLTIIILLISGKILLVYTLISNNCNIVGVACFYHQSCVFFTKVGKFFAGFGARL